MAFNINEFKSQLTGGGARPTLFQVQITNPIDNRGDGKIRFMVRAASIPASNLGQIIVPYFGRQIKMGGDRVFDDWTVSVINDEDFAVRSSLESWSNAINTHISNFRTYPQNYKAQAQVIQYGKDGSVLREYTFEGLFPTQISDIQLGWEATDQIEEFTVNFSYDLWRISGGSSDNSTS